MVDTRNRVISSKPPTLENDFPTKPLPIAPRSAAIISNNKNRPQSAVEYTLYHNPNKAAANNSSNSNRPQQKLFTTTHHGMEEEKDVMLSMNGSEKGSRTRPLSAPQHKPVSTNAQHSSVNPAQPTHFPPTSSNNYFNPPPLKHSNTAGSANGGNILNQSKNVVEQIYSAPYFKNTPSVPHPRVKSAMYNRPSTANNTSSGGNNNTTQMSAVDRALSIGKTRASSTGPRRDSKSGITSHGIEDSRAIKLNEMLEGNIIEKLDNVLSLGNR